METPILPHALHYHNVYEPAEDSFLLIDAIELDIEKIQERRYV